MRNAKTAARLLVALLLWGGTVAARFHFRVEPGEALWFLWVGAQFCCAAGFGYQFALTKWSPRLPGGTRRMSRMDRRSARRRSDDRRV